MDILEKNKKKFAILKKSLNSHILFHSRLDRQQLSLFMESHIYAVWGFMSLLKSLQKCVTPNDIPWIPNINTSNGLVSFINEIVSSEESERFSKNKYLSHFEIYLMAMKRLGASTIEINRLLNKCKKNTFSQKMIDDLSISPAAKKFLKHDIKISLSNSPPKIIGCFALSREKIIPDMFKYILNVIEPTDTNKILRKYLELHISIDSDRHGPLSKKLLNKICVSKKDKIDAYYEANNSIRYRLKVWDSVAKELSLI